MSTSLSPSRHAFVTAGLFGLTGVALGALGAHALAGKLAERGMSHAWETAARYHLFHALAILAAAVWLRSAPAAAHRRIAVAVWGWSAGIVLFSGSLYGLAMGGPRWLGPVTPLGGVALMIAWVAVIAAAAVKEEHAG